LANKKGGGLPQKKELGRSIDERSKGARRRGQTNHLVIFGGNKVLPSGSNKSARIGMKVGLNSFGDIRRREKEGGKKGGSDEL